MTIKDLSHKLRPLLINSGFKYRFSQSDTSLYLYVNNKKIRVSNHKKRINCKCDLDIPFDGSYEAIVKFIQSLNQA